MLKNIVRSVDRRKGRVIWLAIRGVRGGEESTAGKLDITVAHEMFLYTRQRLGVQVRHADVEHKLRATGVRHSVRFRHSHTITVTVQNNQFHSEHCILSVQASSFWQF